MHAALQIPEIVRLVFDILASELFTVPKDIWTHNRVFDIDSDTRKVVQTSLARSARVCRLFSDPALDNLWRFLENLWPLSNFITIYEVDGMSRKDKDDRLDRYARRIQYLQLRDATGHPDRSFWDLLCEWKQADLLPNLQSLFVYINGSDGVATLPLSVFVPASVRGLKISESWVSPFPGLSSYLTTLTERCQEIRALLIHADLSQACILSLLGLQHLEHIQIHLTHMVSFHWTEFFHIASSSSLREIDFSQHFGFDITPSYHSSKTAHKPFVFPSLETLKLCAGCTSSNLAAIRSILQLSSYPRLSYLSLDVYVESEIIASDPYYRHQWSDLFQLLPSLSPQHLRSLHIKSHTEPDRVAAIGLSVATVPALATLSLKSFEIQSPILDPPSMGDLRTITQWWGHLEVLYLDTRDAWGALGVDSLVLIAAQLPKLIDLSLALNLANSDFAAVPALKHPLKSLEVHHLRGPAGTPEKFVKAVDKLFPDLEDWEFYFDYLDDDAALWEDVDRHFRDMKSDRAVRGPT